MLQAPGVKGSTKPLFHRPDFPGTTLGSAQKIEKPAEAGLGMPAATLLPSFPNMSLLWLDTLRKAMGDKE